jgi:hypothetical protein
MLSSEANDVANKEKKKTIAPEHVLKALTVWNKKDQLSLERWEELITGKNNFCLNLSFQIAGNRIWQIYGRGPRGIWKAQNRGASMQRISLFSLAQLFFFLPYVLSSAIGWTMKVDGKVIPKSIQTSALLAANLTPPSFTPPQTSFLFLTCVRHQKLNFWHYEEQILCDQQQTRIKQESKQNKTKTKTKLKLKQKQN